MERRRRNVHHIHYTAINTVYHTHDTAINTVYHTHDTAINTVYHTHDTAINTVYHTHDTAINTLIHATKLAKEKLNNNLLKAIFIYIIIDFFLIIKIKYIATSSKLNVFKNSVKPLNCLLQQH